MMRLFAALLFLVVLPAQAAPMKVVASFSILGDWARQIGGERVQVVTLVGADQDLHGWQPSPGLARQFGDARVLLLNGLNLDDRVLKLARSSGFKGRVAVTTQGIRALAGTGGRHDHGHDRAAGEVDPHAWQDLALAPAYVDNIARAFAEADPAGRAYYAERGARYKAQLAQLQAWAQQQFAALQPKQRRAIVSHDAFAYLARRFGLTLIPVQGRNNESEAGAGGVAQLIRQIRSSGIKAVFVENISNSRLARQIATETGAQLGGELYSDALAPAGNEAADYLGFYRHNVRTLVAGMRRN